MLYSEYARKKFHNLTKTLKLSGYPLTFLSNGKSLKNYKIYGNSIQNGTPTLENPIEVQSVGDLVTDETSEYYDKYDIPIIIRGKNLCTSSQAFYSDLSDYNYMNTTLDDRNCIRFVDCVNVKNSPIEFEENTQYTVQFYCKVVLKGTNTNTSSNNVFTFFYTDGTLSKININAKQRDEWIKKTLTSKEGKTIKYIGINITNYVCYCYIDMDTFQLEKGSVATEYEPYTTPVTTNIYLNEPLRKIGNFADYIDFKNQKVVRYIGEKILDENTPIAIASWRNNSTTRGFLTSRVDEKIYVGGGSKIAVFCNKLKSISYNDNYGAPNYSCISLGASGGPYGFAIRIEDLTLTTASAIKKWLLNNPLTVNYLLKTPTEESVELPKISTVKGTNILTTDTIINPSNMEIEYYKQR